MLNPQVGWFKRIKSQKKHSPLVRAILGVVSSLLMINFFIIPAFILFTHVSFRSLEQAEAGNKLSIGQDIILREMDGIRTITKDYASWNDTYDFVQTRDSTFTSENLDDNALNNLNLNFVAILNTDADILFSKSLIFSDSNTTVVDFDTPSLLQKYPQLLVPQEILSKGIAGLLFNDGKILMAVALPILNSQYEGPSRGTLIFGRFLDDEEDQKLSDMAHFFLFTQSLDDPNTSNEIELAKYSLTGEAASPFINPRPAQCAACHPVTRGSPELAAANPVFISPVNESEIGGYTLLYDLQQKPIAVMGIHLSRGIEALEKSSSLVLLLFYSGFLLILGTIGTFLLTRVITTDEKLENEYKLLRAVIDNVPEQIFAHDVNGRYLLNNLKDAQMKGVDTAEGLLGKSDHDFYPPEKAARYQESEQRIIQTGQAVVDAEEVITRADGEQRWALTTKTPMHDRQGNVTGIVGVTRDITDRKVRERELEVIVTMSRALRSAESSTKLTTMIYNQVIDLLQVDFGTLELIDQESGDSEVIYTYGTSDHINGVRIPTGKGLNTYIRDTGKPYLDNNLAQNPMMLDIMISSGCTAAAGAPMIVEDTLIGFLWIGRRSLITEEELNLLAAMADIAASSIRRITLYELTEKRLNQLLSLRKIDTSINSTNELCATLGVLLEQTCAQLQADAADVLLCSKDIEYLEFYLGHGFSTKRFSRSVIPKGNSPSWEAALTRHYVQVRNLQDLGDAHHLAVAAREEGFVSYFAVPLLVNNQLKGVMEVFLGREFTPDRDWINFMETLAGQAAIAIEQVQLFTGVQSAHLELMQAYDETIEGWVKALDLRDKETEGHSLRVAQLCTELAARMGKQGDDLKHIHLGALLHDIGKMAVPDHILLKPGKLTEEEWVVMRGHPQFAREMLSPISYLRPVMDIPYCHHERWEGGGYPQGLIGEEIPLAARIFSVVDVWDALSTDRPYRKAWQEKDVLIYLEEQAGTQFDPGVIEAFFGLMEEKDHNDDFFPGSDLLPGE